MTSLVSEALARLRAQFAGQLLGRLDAIAEHFQRLNLADWQIAEG